MVEDSKKKIHPIVEEVLELARQGTDKVEFDDYAVEQIEELLKKYSHKPDFLKAVIDLINLAGLLEKEDCSKASMNIILAVSTIADDLKDIKKIKEQINKI